MTNEQTVLQVVQLQQGGQGFMTKAGEAVLQALIEEHLSSVQTNDHSGKEYANVTSVSVIARD